MGSSNLSSYYFSSSSYFRFSCQNILSSKFTNFFGTKICKRLVFFFFFFYHFLIMDNELTKSIIGSEICGVKQAERWTAQYCEELCSEEIKCSDIIGKQKHSGKMDSSNELIQWKPGVLNIAFNKEKTVFFDHIDEAPAKVTEKLSTLLEPEDTKKNNNQN